MKVKWGALAVAGSGKIGGFVASKNRGGSYFRVKATPSNPQSARQLFIRSVLSSLATAWAGLSQAARNAWNGAVGDFASTDVFGDIRNPSGANLYVKLNSNLINAGLAPINTPPIKVAVPFAGFSGAQMTLAGGELVITLENTDLNTEEVIVFATPSLSQGRKFVKNQLRQIGHFTVAANEIGGVDAVFDAYVDKFGIPAIGANIKMQYYPIMATGQAGLPVGFDLDVVA